jgi:hypothetical protein
MNSFEIAKMHFSGVEDDIQITLPKECGIDDDEEKKIEDRVLTINTSAYSSLFCR